MFRLFVTITDWTPAPKIIKSCDAAWQSLWHVTGCHISPSPKSQWSLHRHIAQIYTKPSVNSILQRIQYPIYLCRTEWPRNNAAPNHSALNWERIMAQLDYCHYLQFCCVFAVFINSCLSFQVPLTRISPFISRCRSLSPFCSLSS